MAWAWDGSGLSISHSRQLQGKRLFLSRFGDQVKDEVTLVRCPSTMSFCGALVRSPCAISLCSPFVRSPCAVLLCDPPLVYSCGLCITFFVFQQSILHNTWFWPLNPCAVILSWCTPYNAVQIHFCLCSLVDAILLMEFSRCTPVDALQSMHSSRCILVDALQSMKSSQYTRNLVDRIQLTENDNGHHSRGLHKGTAYKGRELNRYTNLQFFF